MPVELNQNDSRVKQDLYYLLGSFIKTLVILNDNFISSNLET